CVCACVCVCVPVCVCRGGVQTDVSSNQSSDSSTKKTPGWCPRAHGRTAVHLNEEAAQRSPDMWRASRSKGKPFRLHKHTPTHSHSLTPLHTRAHTPTRAHTHSHTHTHTHTLTHTHTHTHTLTHTHTY